ncbi:MAG: PD40 domain-containing protein [Lewinellaceae bacterium]|nr:PD40 domain-containing protein [Lewinellaceae bacterium]
MKQPIWILILLFLFAGNSFGQTKKDFLKAAETEYAAKNYYAALVYYNNVLEFDKNDPEIIFKAAESARMFDSYSHAAEKYQYLIDTLGSTAYPSASFYLAQMKQRMGKYDDARKYYNMFLSENGDLDTTYLMVTKKELSALDYAEQLSQKKPLGTNIERLGTDINTPKSEVASMPYKDDFYYSSMQFNEQAEKNKLARSISKVMVKEGENPPALVKGYLNERNDLVSNTTITADGKVMYYTLCNYINASDIRCSIYKSKVDNQGNLYDEEKLPEPINIEGSTSTQPYITKDESTGKDMLFFVSDRAGGKGQLDIYSSLLDDKYGFAQPINLAINSSGNEISPYFNATTNTLYFSADGREGLGGYDIYKSARIKDNYSSVVGLGLPFNSSYHDIYYTENEKGTIAYLSSNREGSLYLDSYFESCCYDIYKVDIVTVKLDLNALTFDKITGRPLKNATVRLLDKETGEELARVTSDTNNEHLFDLNIDRNYIIIAERENYYPDTIELSTLGMDKPEKIVRKMYLSTDMMLLDVFTHTKIGKLPLEGTTVTLIDMTDQTKKNITITNNLGNDFNFMLDRGKQYKLVATKDGYTDAVEIIDTRPYKESGLITKDMYLDKFVLQDLLPISLYFDNDLPDPQSRSTMTKTNYGDLVQDYMALKEEYKEKYSNPLPIEQREDVKSQYETFFEGDVNGGYDKFKQFLANLQQELEAGNKVELILKGYTSPRADAKYNLTLGQRRVNSIKNEMVLQGNEQLKQYYLSGQLKITDISFGKELAPNDVSDSIADKRNSIYNLKAAKERRVEILRASRN